ncbi:urease accessory protein UreF [Flavobacterium sp. AS60]|uniref:urease accessory protein UreF n=1 Tax=Flavobacterium anseongense TaxID=2910677 RepID=UPI001F45B94F|nr:urease accessory protein UreF [Flavobacterium sp. AS60]MCF6129398.1 urease accessory protein UreF [Flavobacterium sp. AS60]
MSSQLHLLHLCDPTLPIGGFSHSSGLETYTQKEIVNSPETMKIYLTQILSNSILYNEAAFVSLVYEACKNQNWNRIIELDSICNASKLPKEIRNASQKLGTRLMKIFNPRIQSPLTFQIEEAVMNKELFGHYCILFGIYAHELKIPKKEALEGFFYNTAIGYITNAVKLIPLSQDSGQKLLFEITPLLEQLTEKALIPNEALLGKSSVGFDIRSMQHENLYSRLYMS